MNRPRRGEIWSFDVGGGAAMPLVIVQADPLNEVAPTVVGVAVTARRQRAGEALAVPVTPSESGLAAPAWVKVTQLRTVPVSAARDRLGRVPASVLDRVDRGLAGVLNLGGPVR